MTILPNGTSVIGAGLDAWFKRASDAEGPIDIEEFEVEEWRLQQVLGVNHFRLPPDYRRPRFGTGDTNNLRLTVPFLRFPCWNFCPRCKRLSELPLSFAGSRGCDACASRSKFGKGPRVAQVPIVAICEYGHIRDFPWCEWVHHEAQPTCTGELFLKATGGASLGAQSVECSCGKRRTLAGVTEAASIDTEGYPKTYLSTNLADDGSPFLCTGRMPWHSLNVDSRCGRNLRGSLRAASNVYFSLVKSAIYIPRASGSLPPKLLEILDGPPISTLINVFLETGQRPTLTNLRNSRYSDLLRPFSDEQVHLGLEAVLGPPTHDTMAEPDPDEDDVDPDAADSEFRRREQETLREPLSSPSLMVRRGELVDYDASVAKYFSRVMLVDQLRETRALWGFSRVFPEGERRLRDRRSLLWREAPPWTASWLPAYVVHGEGLYLELNEEMLAVWEMRRAIVERAGRLQSRYDASRSARGLREREISPRFVMVHTLAHLLMNRLTYECGYSSASLRERLYVASGARPMAGILIYTAAGDSEGTMGGLVRMGRPGYLETTIYSACEEAQWCSVDPVCMEIGEAGQGPDSCNLAACHGCALVPETACEEFNRFLDRGLVVGTHDDTSIGFFV